MQDYLLISNGQAGNFTYPFDTLAQCVAQGESELRNGQECDVFIKHSTLSFESVTVTPSAAIQAVEAQAVSATPSQDQPVTPAS